ncbi:MAG TPA: hypothetical protein VFN10_17270 [Thermoanaerobaculia bacterium]|nr:hypothetical protein [Thermoanaerobaculia bacterium]
MKKKTVDAEDDPLDREIDFSNARPNPYFVAFHGAKVIRVLEPELAELFPDNESVNDALRTVAASKKKKVSARRAALPSASRAPRRSTKR